MRFWFLLQLLRAVLSELPPPQNVQLDDWTLTWSPSAAERNVTYSVYSLQTLKEEERWEAVTSCQNLPSNVCNVGRIRTADHCVLLRVRAESGDLSSTPVEACSQNGSRCTPGMRLSSRPGSLTIHLSGDHDLAQEFAANVNHQIYLGKEGEELQHYDASSSLTVHDLDEGQRYCVQVHYVVFGRIAGPSSCVQCLEVLQAVSWKPVYLLLVFLLLLLLVVVPVVSYLLIFHYKKIKTFLEPPLAIPQSFRESLHHQHPLTYQPEDEPFHQLSLARLTEEREGGQDPLLAHLPEEREADQNPSLARLTEESSWLPLSD